VSSYAYRMAIAAVTRETFGLTDQDIRPMVTAAPVQMGAKLFVSIHEASWRNTAGDIDWLNEVFGIDLTISVRAGNIPLSQWGLEITSDQDFRLDYAARAMIGLIHGNYPQIMQRANQMLVGGQSIFYRPVHFSYADNPMPRGSAWWGAEDAKDAGRAGVSQTLHFIEAERAEKDAELV